MPVIVKPYHDYTITVDGGDVRLKLARMTVPQYEEFNARFLSFQRGFGNPALHAPMDGTETEDQAARRGAAELEYLTRHAEWQADQFQRYVRVVEGDLVLVHVDGEAEVVTCGRRFWELYAAEAADVFAELWVVNGMSQKKRRLLQSPPDSATGSSTTPSQADPGPRQETAARAAESTGSVEAEGATVPSSAALSGMTASSSSAPALSGN